MSEVASIAPRPAPICANCVHMRGLDSRHPMCAHPDARRNPVDGTLDRPCFSERMAIASYCGPSGEGYWPASRHVGKPGMDGVGNPVQGV